MAVGRRTIRALAGLTVLAGVAGAGYLVGSAEAISNLAVLKVTPTELANAMRADTFYSSYSMSSLVVRGIVSSVSSDKGATVINFKTAGPFGVSCRLDPSDTSPTSGMAVTVVSEGNNALRKTDDVLLTGCVVAYPSAPGRVQRR